MGNDKKALVIGEALIDIVIPFEGEVKEVCGGSPANVALGLGRLGKSVDLVAWVGKDPHGELIRNHLRDSNVVLSDGSDCAQWTSTAKAVLDENSNASYEFNIEWDPKKPVLDDLLVVHTGSIGATLFPGAETVLEILDEARQQATVTYDPNIRPTIMGERDNVYDHIMSIAKKCDVVKASHEDVQWLEPDKSYQEFGYGLVEAGVKFVAVTLAEKGVWVCTASGLEKVFPTLAENVVDTVGAGDSFMAGIINGLWDHGLLGDENRQDLANISGEVLDSVMLHASKIAAITVSRKGADLPYLSEL